VATGSRDAIVLQDLSELRWLLSVQGIDLDITIPDCCELLDGPDCIFLQLVAQSIELQPDGLAVWLSPEKRWKMAGYNRRGDTDRCRTQKNLRFIILSLSNIPVSRSKNYRRCINHAPLMLLELASKVATVLLK
jgi:hypothetical protein